MARRTAEAAAHRDAASAVLSAAPRRGEQLGRLGLWQNTATAVQVRWVCAGGGWAMAKASNLISLFIAVVLAGVSVIASEPLLTRHKPEGDANK